jgi:polar amino acid transport system substrate-binding protein
MMKRYGAAVLLLLATAGCDLPRDADHTLDRVQQGTLRVGIIENPPWVSDSAGPLQGVEVQLVRGAAAELQSRVAWVPGTESELLASLHGRELDLVIGGLSRKSPWKKQVAFSRAYYVDSTLVSPLSPEQTSALKGDSIAIRAGDPAAVELRKKGGVPVPVSELAGVRGLLAAPIWRLSRLGRPVNGVVVHTEQRVMAVAPGENAWLSWLERWLYRQRSSIPAMLRASSP